MNLQQWLDYQLAIHPKNIEFGLERVGEVARRLGIARPASRVITVAGTNGKGSTVAFIESIARCAGYRVGAYTSPHLLRYNERVRVGGREVEDDALIAAFTAIEAARDGISLTYFEYGTLAALWVFAQEKLDLVVLEVGLGGRLDAVNLVDADVAVITTIDVDHVEYLGADRSSIAREKAGIFRAGKPAIIAEPDPPESLFQVAEEKRTPLLRSGIAYRWQREADGWTWQDDQIRLSLPLPTLRAPAQLANAAAAIAALRATDLTLSERIIAEGVQQARVAGRMQVIPGPVEIVLDVAHNPQSARQLAQWLQDHSIAGKTHAVFAALADKDVGGELRELAQKIDRWYLAGLSGVAGRSQSVRELADKLLAVYPALVFSEHDSVALALQQAQNLAEPGDRLVVFGSFHTVAEAMLVLASAD